jgi:hypothetical protein
MKFNNGGLILLNGGIRRKINNLLARWCEGVLKTLTLNVPKVFNGIYTTRLNRSKPCLIDQKN